MPYKILIVEDNFDSADLLLMWLGMEGYKTVCAQDGREGFDMAMSEAPDLILTDLMMPNVGGVEMIKMLRAEPRLATVPVAVLTAYRNHQAQEAMAVGANAVTYKPVLFERLCAMIQDLLPRY